MEEINFWKTFCKNCDKRCCKRGPLMVLPQERQRIVRITGKKDCFENHGKYFILRGKPCLFLKEDGTCEINDIKPLDCRAYPIFAKPINNLLCEWLVDKDCPACDRLPGEFVRYAKRLFLSLPSELREADWNIAFVEAGFNTKKL